MVENHFEVTLELDTFEDLFSKPNVSPIEPNYRGHSFTSGIEYIAGELYANSSYRSVATTLVVPANEATRFSSDEMSDAIQRYTDGKLRDLRQGRSAVLWRGTRFLAVAIVALFVFLGLSKIAKENGNAFLDVIGEGLAIAGWVALWFPLDMLFFEVWRLRLDRRIYERVAEMTLEIKHS